MSGWKDADHDYWEATSYDIRQIVLTKDYQAVFAEEDDPSVENGPMHLEAYDIEALGVADATAKTYRQLRTVSKPPAPTIVNTESYCEIVGLQLCDGSWDIVNYSCNFAGLIQKGQDINQATDYLECRFLDRLPKETDKSDQAPEEATNPQKE